MPALRGTAIGRQLSNLLFSKLLAIILLANLFSLVFCNVLRVPLWVFVLAYPTSLLGASLLIFPASVKRTPLMVSSAMILWIGVFALLIVSLRLPYVLEWIPGNTVHVTWDDPVRISGLISMTLSESFPLKHFANQDYLYSYYYASMIPLAFLKLVLPLLTLKDVLFIGNALYCFVVLASLLEVANLLCPNHSTLWIMVFLHTAFGGLDWLADMFLSGAPLVHVHHDLWQWASLLHGNAAIPSFFSSLVWSFPNLLGSYALVLAFVFLKKVRYKRKLTKTLVVGFLLIAAFYSSVFSVMASPLFFLADFRILYKRFIASKALPVLLITFLLPISLFLHKPSSIGFVPATFHLELTDHYALNKVLSLPVWLVLVTMIEFCCIPVIVALLLPLLTRREKAYFIAAIAFFISTYVVAYSGFNNYSMRGLLLPMFVFYFLFAKYAPQISRLRVWWTSQVRRYFVVIPLCLLFSFGTVVEFLGHVRESAKHMALGYKVLLGEDPRLRFPVDYRKLARDRSMRIYKPTVDKPMRCYNAEKMIEGVPLERMRRGELLQLRLK